jgi:transcriptional regulator
MEQETILQLQVKKHVKIYKLKQLGLKNSEIAKALNTNAGHVYNALKKYDLKPEFTTIADEIA